MKIAFVGKGGSGKTSISGLFVHYVLSLGLPVMAIDSDINQHLGSFLGLDSASLMRQPRLGDSLSKIVSFIAPDQMSRLDHILRTTPPTSSTTPLRPFENNELFKHFAIDKDNLRFLAVGLPPEEQIGEKCYHSNMGALSFLLNNTIDRPNEYIIVDLTAGIDTLISGVFISYDLVFVIVEPTIPSIRVYQDYQKYLDKLALPTKLIPIGNKIMTDEDATFIENQLQRKLEAVIGISPFVRALERGNRIDWRSEDTRTIDALATIKHSIDHHTKDWPFFYQTLLQFHRKKAATRPDKDTLLKQIDTSFDITQSVEALLK